MATLRGVESNGMILSATELRLGEDAAGIMVLDDGIAPGTPLADVLPLSETVLELEITSNRPDCLGSGVSRGRCTRSPARRCGRSTSPSRRRRGRAAPRTTRALEVRAPDLCPRYMARVLTDVSVGPSPPGCGAASRPPGCARSTTWWT